MKQLPKISMLFRRSGRSFLRFVFIGSICILTAVAIQGCDFKLKDPLGASPQVYNRLYASYLNGDTNVARGALKETVQLLQNNRSAHGQAFGLFLAYSRLYALEARVGDPDLAEAYFIKARYWSVIDAEIGNGLPRETGKKSRAFTTNACIEMVDDWDRKQPGGKTARYLRDNYDAH